MNKDKKLEKLESKLSIYSYLKNTINKNNDLIMKNLSLTHLNSKIDKLNKQISKLQEPIVAETPKYGPSDEIIYEGNNCMVMSVNYQNKTYNLKTPSDKIDVKWGLVK